MCEKLAVAQLIKHISFYGTQRHIIIVTRVSPRMPILNQMNPVHILNSHFIHLSMSKGNGRCFFPPGSKVRNLAFSVESICWFYLMLILYELIMDMQCVLFQL
jgi:hypothetical protein